jgi:hypothetical protein
MTRFRFWPFPFAAVFSFFARVDLSLHTEAFWGVTASLRVR